MIPEVEQAMTDFDWFGVDENGYVGHFTTAGFKLLPKSVSASAEDLKKVTDYFKQVKPRKAGYSVNADLEKHVGPFENENEKAKYLSDFSEMAVRGLYSFDIDTYVKPGLAYFCVAIPLQPLTLDLLPADIRSIVARTVLKGIRFEETTEIEYASSLAL